MSVVTTQTLYVRGVSNIGSDVVFIHALQRQKTRSLSTCFATGSFGSQGNVFVAYHLAMPVLCALTVAQAAAASLRAQCQNEEEIEKMAEDLEVIKEVLAQVSVNKTYVQHFSMTNFCSRVLWSTRGLLLQWDIPSTSLQEVPVPHMPGLERNKVWTIEHSNREMYLSEVTASLNFLLAQQNHLTGEPWDWLFHFLHQLEYNLL